MRLQALIQHEKWFDVPGFPEAKILVREVADYAARDYAEGLIVAGYSSAVRAGRDLVRQLRLDAVIDWQGITDSDGHPLPVTEENKMLLLAQEWKKAKGGEEKRSMLDFIVECMAEVKSEGEKLRQEAEKN